MSKIIGLAICLTLAMAGIAGAWTLSWNASEGEVTGYKVYYNAVDVPADVTEVDRGTALNYSLDDIGLTPGTRYEFWATAYNATGESPDSDHLRWTTPPAEPVIIEMMGAPVQIIINP